MENFNCPVCNKEMEIHHKIMYVDYSCDRSDSHHFSWRIRDNNLAKLRIRLDDGLCLKVHYDEKYSEAWTSDKPDNKIRVNQIVIPNFEDLDKLKNKIRTLLVFG